MGLTFKENCPDIRNTKVIDVINELDKFGCNLEIHDPWVKKGDQTKFGNLKFIENIDKASYDGIILAVSHYAFQSLGADEIRSYGKSPHVFFDMKSVFSKARGDIHKFKRRFQEKILECFSLIVIIIQFSRVLIVGKRKSIN